jgi:hypothetical protein
VLRDLIAGVLPPVPYREDGRWPMDRAFHRIEMQALEGSLPGTAGQGACANRLEEAH